MTETRYFVRALPLEIEFAGDKAQTAPHPFDVLTCKTKPPS